METTRPTLREAMRTWLSIGLNSFGGPAGQIAVLHEEVVVRRRWLSESRFLRALDLCMLLPGPEAQQLAVYAGWSLHGVRGGLAAGILFVAPGALAMLALCWFYVGARDLAWFQAAFTGIQCAVVALVVLAIHRIAKRALRATTAWLLALIAFFATSVADVPFPIVVACGLAVGLVLGKLRPSALLSSTEHTATRGEVGPRTTILRTVRTAALGITIWLAPVAAILALDPGRGIQAEMARFFTGASVVTFGGAYSALSYTADHAGGTWISSAEMADGLGLAESTPGPLILVLQFVAFVGAHHEPGEYAPIVAGILATAVMLWTTFAPCFVWIFVLAPWVERVGSHRALASALAGVSACVVGVIADLALWFATHVLFRASRVVELDGFELEVPVWSSVDAPRVILAAIAGVLLVRFRVPVPWVVVAAAACGVAGHFLA